VFKKWSWDFVISLTANSLSASVSVDLTTPNAKTANNASGKITFFMVSKVKLLLLTING
jgi:hypothetical protein